MAYYFTNKLRGEVGKNIRKARQQRNMKLVDVAEDAGINANYYGKIERGQVNPSLDKIFKIVKALKVKSSDILPF